MKVTPGEIIDGGDVVVVLGRYDTYRWLEALRGG